MKRLAFVALLLLAVVACDRSPSEPAKDEYDRYSIYLTVYNADKTIPVAGAKGVIEDMHTKQKEQVLANDLGSIGPVSWESDPRHSGVRIIMEKGYYSGLTYESYDEVHNPSCVEDPSDDNHGICRVNIELKAVGIG